MNVATCRSNVCHTSVDGVSYGFAESTTDQQKCLSLVHDCYVSAGLMQQTSHGMRILPDHCEPYSTILMGHDQGQIVCTATVILDNPNGLPIAELYPDEIQRRRDQGLRLAEVSCLASAATMPSQRRTRAPIARMMTLLGGFSAFVNVDRLVITVHPRHAKFYSRKFGFEPFGPEKLYSKVCDRPAVPCEIVDIPAVLNGLLDGDPLFTLPKWRVPTKERLSADLLIDDAIESR